MTSIPYRIRRSDRARHARILVGGEGVEVVVPRRFPEHKVEPFVEEKRPWIERTLRRMAESDAQLPPARRTVIVSHGATIMALTNGLLGLNQRLHLLGPLANCHWTELYAEPRGDGPQPVAESGNSVRWRLRGHNLGAPGTVVPLPALAAGEEASDADA